MSLERMLENAVSAAGRVEETGLTVSVVNCSEDPDKTPAEQPPASSSRKAKRDRSKTRRRNGTDPGFSESSEDEDEDEDGDESESEGDLWGIYTYNNGSTTTRSKNSGIYTRACPSKEENQGESAEEEEEASQLIR